MLTQVYVATLEATTGQIRKQIKKTQKSKHFQLK